MTSVTDISEMESRMYAYPDAIREYLEKEADIILHGHALRPDNITLMGKVLQGAREIAEGKTRGDEVFHWFGGDGKDRQHPYDNEGSVICYR